MKENILSVVSTAFLTFINLRDEALIIYVPKINIFIENYNKDLMSRKVKLVANNKNTYNLTYQPDSTYNKCIYTNTYS